MPKQEQFSPLPKKSQTQINNNRSYNFYDVLRKVFEENVSATRQEWNMPHVYIKMHNSKLCIYNEDKIFHPLIVTDGDIAGTDWVLI